MRDLERHLAVVAGGVPTSPGLNVFVMVAMILVELWLISLLSLR